MNCIAPMRRAALLLFAASGVFAAAGLALAQSPALPATPPTAAQPAAAVPAAAAAPVAHRARVVFSGGQLEITADNSSLNQILRDVARQTGMKITGGVADQRVFGKYGPGAPGGILASLLDGTGSNMMLRENAAHTPVELVLTPREGGVTPPSPNTFSSEDDAPAIDESPAQPAAPPSPQSQGPQQPSAPQASGFGGAPVAVPVTGANAAPSASPPPTVPSDPQSPNGVVTPQQIFEQLQQLQLQQKQPSSK
jgi:hypothetical protein